MRESGRITGYVVTPYAGIPAQAPVNFDTATTKEVISGVEAGTSCTCSVLLPLWCNGTPTIAVSPETTDDQPSSLSTPSDAVGWAPRDQVVPVLVNRWAEPRWESLLASRAEAPESQSRLAHPRRDHPAGDDVQRSARADEVDGVLRPAGFSDLRGCIGLNGHIVKCDDVARSR